MMERECSSKVTSNATYSLAIVRESSDDDENTDQQQETHHVDNAENYGEEISLSNQTKKQTGEHLEASSFKGNSVQVTELVQSEDVAEHTPEQKTKQAVAVQVTEEQETNNTYQRDDDDTDHADNTENLDEISNQTKEKAGEHLAVANPGVEGHTTELVTELTPTQDVEGQTPEQTPNQEIPVQVTEEQMTHVAYQQETDDTDHADNTENHGVISNQTKEKSGEHLAVANPGVEGHTTELVTELTPTQDVEGQPPEQTPNQEIPVQVTEEQMTHVAYQQETDDTDHADNTEHYGVISNQTKEKSGEHLAVANPGVEGHTTELVTELTPTQDVEGQPPEQTPNQEIPVQVTEEQMTLVAYQQGTDDMNLPIPDLPNIQQIRNVTLNAETSDDDFVETWTRESEHPVYSRKAQVVCRTHGLSLTAIRTIIEKARETGVLMTWDHIANIALSRAVHARDIQNAATQSLDIHTEQGSPDGELIQQIHLECRLCDTNETNALFLPCAHLVCCMPCARDLAICPRCKEAVKEAVKVYR